MMAMKLVKHCLINNDGIDDDDDDGKGAPGVEWWLTVTSIAKRIIGKNTRIIAGYSLS